MKERPVPGQLVFTWKHDRIPLAARLVLSSAAATPSGYGIVLFDTFVMDALARGPELREAMYRVGDKE